MSLKIVLHQSVLAAIPVLRGVLSEEKVQTISALSAQEVILQSKNFQPDLVIVSDQMSEMKAYEVCRQIKEMLPSAHLFAILDTQPQEDLSETYRQIDTCVVYRGESQVDERLATLVLPKLNLHFHRFVQVQKNLKHQTHDARLLERVSGYGFVHFTWRGRDISSKIENLNLRGLLFRSEAEMLAQSEIDAVIEAPFNEKIDLSMKIVRVEVNTHANAAEKKFICGAQFTKLTEQKAKFIEKLFQYSKERLAEPAQLLRKSERLPIAEKVDLKVFLQMQDESTIEVAPVNLSVGGAMLASAGALQPMLQVTVLFDWNGKNLNLPAAVIRSAKLKVPVDGFPFGVAVEFVNVSAEKQVLHAELIEHVQVLLESKKPIPPASVRSILSAQPDLVAKVFQSGQHLYPWQHLASLEDFEQRELLSQGPYAKAVQGMLLLLGKNSTFCRFLPQLAAEPKVLAGFTEDLEKLYQEIQEVEQSGDDALRFAVKENLQDDRLALIKLMNQYDEGKKSLYFQVADTLGAHPSFLENETVKNITQKALALRLSGSHNEVSVKFARKYVFEEAPKEVAKSANKSEKKIPYGLIFVAGFLLVTVGLGAFISMKKTYLKPDVLEVPMEILMVEVTEPGLVITCMEDAWKKLKPEVQNSIFLRLEDYLYKNKMKQAKIIDNSNNTMAATTVLVFKRGGERPDYKRRHYNKK